MKLQNIQGQVILDVRQGVLPLVNLKVDAALMCDRVPEKSV